MMISMVHLVVILYILDIYSNNTDIHACQGVGKIFLPGVQIPGMMETEEHQKEERVMYAPILEIDTKKVTENAKKLHDFCTRRGVELAFATKGFSARPEVIRAAMAGESPPLPIAACAISGPPRRPFPA